MGENRIAKYIREMDSTVAKVVVVTDMLNQRVVLSIKGETLTWQWVDEGLLCPGASTPIAVHPLAAEVIVEDELNEFLGMEGIGENEVIYVSADGTSMDSAYMHPIVLGEPTYRLILARETLKRLYRTYGEQGRKLTEDLIGESISVGALGAFLTLINL